MFTNIINQPIDVFDIPTKKAKVRSRKYRTNCIQCGLEVYTDNLKTHMERKHSSLINGQDLHLISPSILFPIKKPIHKKTLSSLGSSRRRKTRRQIAKAQKPQEVSMFDPLSFELNKSDYNQNTINNDLSLSALQSFDQIVIQPVSLLNQEEIKEVDQHKEIDCQLCEGNCMFKINEIDFDFKKQPKEYLGMRKYEHLLKQIEDIKIGRDMTRIRYATFIDYFTGKARETDEQVEIKFRTYGQIKFKKLLYGYSKVFLINEVNKDAIKLATNIPAIKNLYKLILDEIFRRYFLQMIRRNIMNGFQALIDEENGVLSFSLLINKNRIEELNFSLTNFFNIPNFYKQFRFKTELIWIPGKYDRVDAFTDQSSIFIQSAFRYIELGQEVGNILEHLLRDLIVIKYDYRDPLKRDFMVMLFQDFYSKIIQIKGKSRSLKGSRILKITKQFHDLVYLVLEKNTKVYRGTLKQIWLEYSSEKEKWAAEFKEKFYNEPNQLKWKVLKMLKMQDLYVVQVPCENDQHYLIQRNGKDVEQFCSCQCSDHIDFNPIQPFTFRY